jgi:hypothetical protein
LKLLTVKGSHDDSISLPFLRRESKLDLEHKCEYLTSGAGKVWEGKHDYYFTPWNRILEKLIVTQLVKFPGIYTA